MTARNAIVSVVAFTWDVEAMHTEFLPVACDFVGDEAMSAVLSCLTEGFSSSARTATMLS